MQIGEAQLGVVWLARRRPPVASLAGVVGGGGVLRRGGMPSQRYS